MARDPGQAAGGEPGRSKIGSAALWVCLALSAGAVLLGLLFFAGGKGPSPARIPPEALSKIEGEKARAQREYAEFIRTPAGKLWQKHPYWDPAACQKIVEGQVFAGMSKEQAREAVAAILEMRPGGGERGPEEWVVESKAKERMVLRFEGNALVDLKKAEKNPQLSAPGKDGETSAGIAPAER